MEIVDIFALVNNSLYAVKYDNEDGNTYRSLINRWQDVAYLEQFFEDNKKDLQSGFYGNITIEEAVFQTIDESARFDRIIFNSAKKGLTNTSKVLEEVVFRSLHENDYSHIHIPSKAYGPENKSWLRVYAIRIAENLYVISGGAIKLTRNMEAPSLKLELRKLKATADYLKEIGFEFEEDLGYIEIGNNEAD